MPASQKNIALLCNPTSKKALRVGDEIAVRLRRKNISFSLFTSYWPAVWNGFTEAWLVGGDGTANFFINQYPDVALPIVLFAGGTGNDLHAALYGKTTAAHQIDNVLTATPRPVDAGRCNGRLFLNGIGIGFDGAVVKSLVAAKKQNGNLSYLTAIFKHLFSYREQPYTVTLNEKRISQDCFMISITNGNSFGGGFRVAPKASVTDGLLDVLLVGTVNVVARLRYLPVIQKGAHLHLPFITYQQTAGVVVKCNTTVAAHCDGEYFSADTFEITCLIKRFSFLY